MMNEVVQRRDGPALRDTALWLVLLGLSACGGIAFWASWGAVPFWIFFGLLHGSAATPTTTSATPCLPPRSPTRRIR